MPRIAMKKTTKYIILALAIVLLIFLFPKLKTVASVETIRGLIEPFGVLAPLAFGVLYIFSVLFFVPATAFTIAAGVLFGTWLALGIVLVAALVSAGLAFLIGRKFSDHIPKVKTGLIRKLQDRVDKECHENTFQAILILRLLYFPYIALSYAAGLVKTAKLGQFLLATFLGNIVGSFVFVYLGDSLSKGPKALIIPAVLIVVTLLIPRVVKKLTGKSAKV